MTTATAEKNRMSTSGIAAVRRTARTRRHFRLRKKVQGSPSRPRLAVTKSARHIYAQLVDDVQGVTLASASTYKMPADSGDKTAQARIVGQLIAEQATAAGITSIVFDRGGNKYHGRIAALADAARAGGLEF